VLLTVCSEVDPQLRLQRIPLAAASSTVFVTTGTRLANG
jgi:hypothetical protein